MTTPPAPKIRPAPLLYILAFVAFISLGLPDTILGVAWPFMRATFHQPLDRLGLLLMGNMVGYLATSFFGGQIMRAIGVGRLLAGSCLLVTLALLGYAISPVWYLLIPVAVVGGLGAGAIDAGINAYAATHFSPRVVNWLHAFFGIGATIGPALMTVILANELSWRIGYGVLAVMLAILTGLFVGTVRLWDAPGQTSGDAHPPVASISEALRRPIVWANAAIFFVYCGIESTAGQLLFTLFTESRGISLPLAGSIVSGYWAALTIGRFVFGHLAHHFGAMAIIRTGVTLAVLATGMLYWNPVPAVGLTGAVLLGFGLAPIFPTLISITPLRVGERFAPQAIGLQVSTAAVAIGLVPSTVAAIASRRGLEFISLELFLACCTLLVLQEAVQRGVRKGR